MESRQTPLVLFLCTENAARSQMAEVILRSRAGGRIAAASAGMEPTAVHPLAIQVLAEQGLGTAGLRAKSAAEFLGKVSVRYAVIVCERAQQSCPRVYPFATRTLYWPFPDPAAFQGTEADRLARFREVRDQLAERIDQWLAEVGGAP
jgi:arsenate reductase